VVGCLLHGSRDFVLCCFWRVGRTRGRSLSAFGLLVVAGDMWDLLVGNGIIIVGNAVIIIDIVVVSGMIKGVRSLGLLVVELCCTSRPERMLV